MRPYSRNIQRDESTHLSVDIGSGPKTFRMSPVFKSASRLIRPVPGFVPPAPPTITPDRAVPAAFSPEAIALKDLDPFACNFLIVGPISIALRRHAHRQPLRASGWPRWCALGLALVGGSGRDGLKNPRRPGRDRQRFESVAGPTSWAIAGCPAARFDAPMDLTRRRYKERPDC